MKRLIFLWGPAVLYMALIFYSSSQPDMPLPPGLTDKPTHSLGYMVLGILFVRALAGGLPARITLSTAVFAVALTTAYGATDEIHQMFVPGRFADWNDLLADAFGGALGALACWLWGILFRSRHGL